MIWTMIKHDLKLCAMPNNNNFTRLQNTVPFNTSHSGPTHFKLFAPTALWEL